MPKEYLKELGVKLDKYIGSVHFERDHIRALFGYSVEPGHKLRSGLVVIGCEAVGGGSGKVWPAAAAIETLHKSTLIHDDMVDEDEMRRGVQTFHVKYGRELGIVSGDLVSSMAFEMLKELEKTFDPAKVLKCYEILSRAYEGVYRGQLLDLLFEEGDTITEKKYMEMITNKTVAIMESALEMGAVLGSGSGKEIDMLSTFARDFGLAFQIQNDVNNLLFEEEIGRRMGSDIHQGKRTLIVAKTLQDGSDDEKERLLEVLGKEKCSQEKVDGVIEMLKRNGSIDHAMKMARKFADRARNDIKDLQESKSKDYLLKLVDYILIKTYWKEHATSMARHV